MQLALPLWLRQYTGTKIRNLLVPRLLEAAHDKGTMMLEISAQWYNAWKKRPMVTQYLKEAPNGSAMLITSAQWRRNAEIEHQMVARHFKFAPDGWQHDALIFCPMAGRAMLKFHAL